MKKEKIKKSELFDYIIHTIKNNIKGFSKKGLNRKEKKRLSNLKKVYPLIQEQLAAAGIPKTKTADFLKKQISDFKKMPSAYDIFKTKSDKLYNFKFVEDIQVEREGRCIIVYVPFLSTEEQKASAINYTRGKFNNDLKKGRRLYPVIAYHGNPFSKGMDDKKAQLRIDHNKQVIESVIEGLSKSKSIPKNRQIQILCSHLHKSNSPYDWTTDFSKTVSLIPLGVTDYIVLDTKKGNFSKAVTYKKIPWL